MRSAATIVVGAGQAGLALSHHLAAAGHDHVVLERGRVGERWRSERWESLTLLTPNWHNRLPGAAPLADPAGFLDRRGFVDHLEDYAANAPVLEQTTVLRVRRAGHGYCVASDAGDWSGGSVVIATGDSDAPAVPAIAAAAPPFLHQTHASGYRRPDALPEGAVLVVGAGPSGQQIAAELARAGRAVTLASGRHARLPRRYRGRDIYEWLGAIGHLGTVTDGRPVQRSVGPPLSGRDGGESLGLERLAAMGVAVCGRLEGFAGRHAILGANLRADARAADERMRRRLDSIDAHIEATGTPAGPRERPAAALPDPGPASIDLAAAGIATIVWATGYRRSYPWLHVPVRDAAGELIQRGGMTPAPGLFALGLYFQRTRSSHAIGGVGADAAMIAARITGERDLAPRRLARAA